MLPVIPNLVGSLFGAGGVGLRQTPTQVANDLTVGLGVFPPYGMKSGPVRPCNNAEGCETVALSQYHQLLDIGIPINCYLLAQLRDGNISLTIGRLLEILPTPRPLICMGVQVIHDQVARRPGSVGFRYLSPQIKQGDHPNDKDRQQEATYTKKDSPKCQWLSVLSRMTLPCWRVLHLLICFPPQTWRRRAGDPSRCPSWEWWECKSGSSPIRGPWPG